MGSHLVPIILPAMTQLGAGPIGNPGTQRLEQNAQNSLISGVFALYPTTFKFNKRSPPTFKDVQEAPFANCY